MLSTLTAANPKSTWNSFYRSFCIEADSENVGSVAGTVVGTNFNPNTLSYQEADGDSHTLQCVLRNYTSGQTLTLRCFFFCTVTTGTKTWTAKIAAITPGDAQSCLTKTFGTGVASAATSPNGTANGLYVVSFVFDTSAKLNSADNGDLAVFQIAQTAHVATSGIAYLIGADVFNSG